MHSFLRYIAYGLYAIGGAILLAALFWWKFLAMTLEQHAWVVYGLIIAAILFALGAEIDARVKRKAAKHGQADL